MYTGTMFRSDVAKLFEQRDPPIKEVAKLINENCKVFQITKNENEKLHKTKREGNLFEYYKENKVIIDNIEVKIILFMTYAEGIAQSPKINKFTL